MEASKREELATFFNGYCYGFPSNAQSTERAVKAMRPLFSNKPGLRAVVGRQRQLQRCRAASDRAEIAAKSQRRRREASSGVRTKQPQRLRMRSAAAERTERVRLALQRSHTVAERKGARATTAAPEAASQLQEARKIVATAAKVGERAKGHRTRKCFRDFVVKFGVVGDRIVPKTPAKFQGRVNVASLSTYDSLYKQLERYGVGGWARGDGQNTGALKALLLAAAGVEEETELTGRGNDTRIVQYLKPVPDTAETAPVTDTVSEATDEDMFVSGGGEAADRATSSDSEEEEEVSRRPQRNRRAPNRPDV